MSLTHADLARILTEVHDDLPWLSDLAAESRIHTAAGNPPAIDIQLHSSTDAASISTIGRLVDCGWVPRRTDAGTFVRYEAVFAAPGVEISVWDHLDRQEAAIPGQGYVAVMDTPDVPVYADRAQLTREELAEGWRWVVPALDGAVTS
jgi:hypothetical protein